MKNKKVIGLVIGVVGIAMIAGGLVYKFLFGNGNDSTKSEVKTSPLKTVKLIGDNLSEFEELDNGYYYTVDYNLDYKNANVNVYSPSHKVVHTFKLSDFSNYDLEGIKYADSDVYILNTTSKYVAIGKNNKVITEVVNIPNYYDGESIKFFVDNDRSSTATVYDPNGKVLLSNVKVGEITYFKGASYLSYYDSTNEQYNIIDSTGKVVYKNGVLSSCVDADRKYARLKNEETNEYILVDKNLKNVAEGYTTRNVSSPSFIDYDSAITEPLYSDDSKTPTKVFDTQTGELLTVGKDVHLYDTFKEEFEKAHTDLQLHSYARNSLEKNKDNDFLVKNIDSNSENYHDIGIYRVKTGTVDYLFYYEDSSYDIKLSGYDKYDIEDNDNNIYMLGRGYSDAEYIYDFDNNKLLLEISYAKTGKYFSSYTLYEDGYYEVCYSDGCGIYDKNNNLVVEKSNVKGIYLVDKKIITSFATTSNWSSGYNNTIPYSISKGKFLIETAGTMGFEGDTTYFNINNSVYILKDESLVQLNGEYVSKNSTDIYVKNNNTLEAYNFISKDVNTYTCESFTGYVSINSNICKNIYRSTLITLYSEDGRNAKGVKIVNKDGKELATISATSIEELKYTSTGDVLLYITNEGKKELYLVY